MLIEIILEAWVALKRNLTRSFLTMLGIVWGIATVTLLIAYGNSFRSILVHGFDAFGKSVVICWPQQTSEQPGGQRAGKKVVIEQADVDLVKATAPLVRHVCRETVNRPGIAYGDRLVGTAAVRGVCPEYGEMRNEVPSEGRWIDAADELERRRVIFLGGRTKEQLFSGRPAIGETVEVGGVRFTVIGVMARKIQLSNYFSSDDDSAWIPYSTAGEMWNTRYAAVLLFEPIAPQFEKKAMAQVLAAVATRQNFSPTDPKAIQMFGRDEFRPVIDALTIGLQVLLAFVGTLTLGIGGVGVMNIMLMSVTERTREIGVRKAIGARRRDIIRQFLTEAITLTATGGIVGVALGAVISFLINKLLPSLPSAVPLWAVVMAVGGSMSVGLFFGMYPALKASRLDPVDALRYE
jgi:putative ABC transport system permease protein